MATKQKSYTAKELRDLGIIEKREKEVIYPHGSGGLFTTAAVRPEMYSTIPSASNLLDALPVFQSSYEQVSYEILTGQTASDTTQAADHCGVAPVAGNLKTCNQTILYGDYTRKSQMVNAFKSALRKNRIDTDRRIMNPPNISSPWMPSVVQNNPTVLNSPKGKAMFELGNQVMLDMSYATIQGDITKVGVARRPGFIREFNGLSWWIRTGYVDAVSSVACPAADSYVVTTPGALDATRVATITNAFRTVHMDALSLNLGDVRWAIVINPYMLHALYDVWSCNFALSGCTDDTLRQMATDVNNLRINMMNGQYLPIDNLRVPVLYDHNVPVTINSTTGAYTSDIFIVPLARNGTALTYFDYVPLDVEDVAAISGDGFGDIRVINNGLWMVTRDATGACITYQIHGMMRLIMDTPFLAARIDDTTYTSNVPFRSPIIGAPRYKNGGQTSRPA